ncbi:MAG TPA: hypothetical protein VNC41_18145, partial [Acidimicrobiia bacterium]|nr:hypothetical protein [Acidimicrobiia bacterium]
LVVLASLSAIVLVAAAVPFVREVFVTKSRTVRTIGTGDPIIATLGITLAGFAVVYPLATLLRMGFSERTAVFDRYALPFLPLIGLLFLRSVAARRAEADVAEPAPNVTRTRALTGVALGALVLLGFVYASESASFDATRWAVAEDVVAQGYSPLQIHAGYEWEGWFSGQGPRTSDSIKERQALRADYFKGMCVTIAVAPPKLPKEYLAIATSDALTRKPTTFVATRNKRPCDVPPGRGVRGEQSPR